MNLNLVRAFVALGETGSFSRAARSLALPTSSVSRAVARLEAELHTSLVERTTRKTALTAAGKLYFDHARRALEVLEDGEARLEELLDQPRGEVSLSVPMNVDGGFLARCLVAFQQSHPLVRLRVVPTNRRVDLHEEGFDLALRVLPRPDAGDVVLRELGSFHAWLVASSAYLRARGRPRRPADLVRHTCVNFQGYTVGVRLRGPDGVTPVEVTGPIVANDLTFVRQLVEEGAGIGPLVFSPGDEPTLGRMLVRVLPDYVVEGPKLYVASMSRKGQPLVVRRLRDHLVDAYGRIAKPASGGRS